MVGPNGSGKSNVIDAMLFVFGKRAKQVMCQLALSSQPVSTTQHCCQCAAALQLRLNKVSELIHNSTNHKNLAMAKVGVHFQDIIDMVRLLLAMLSVWQYGFPTFQRKLSYVLTLQGPETFEFVPNSQFTVSRTAHRNNSSDYYIDDKKSNFTEVTKLLKSKGIDLDNNRFLILQVCLDKVPAFVVPSCKAYYLF